MKTMNIDEIREVVSEELAKVRSGKGDMKVAQAVANLSGKLIKSIALEIEYEMYKKEGGKAIKCMERE